MIKQLKAITVNMLAGANTATAAIMLMSGLSDRIDPTAHPLASCAGLAFPLFLAINMAFLVFWLFFKPRMIFIPLAGFAACIAPIRIYLPISKTQEVPEGALMVMSYNVKAFNGTGSEPHADNLESILQYIKRHKPDILCLQEDMGGNRDTRQRLDSIFPHADTLNIGSPMRNAIGIYSRFAIIRRERIEYPSDGNGSAAYYLKTGTDTVIVINNHFESTHIPIEHRQAYKKILKGDMQQDTARRESKKLIRMLAEANQKRAPQADAVARYIDSHSQYPIILCGDFNDSPISYTHRTLAERLTDCYAATGCGIGLSYNQKGFFVRIDNIMCSRRFSPYNCKVDNSIAASDHYPIYCWLKMEPKR